MPLIGRGSVQRVPHVRWSGLPGPTAAPQAGTPYGGASVLRPTAIQRRPASGRAAPARILGATAAPVTAILRGLTVSRPRQLPGGKVSRARATGALSFGPRRGLLIARPRRLTGGSALVRRIGAPIVVVNRTPLRGLQLRGSRIWRPGRLTFLRFPLGSSVAQIFELRQAVVAWLKSMSSIQDLVQGRVYFEQPSQAAVYPCVVVEVTKRSYGHNHSGPDGTSHATVQITALALAELMAIRIMEVVRNNVDGFRGTQSGVPILRCFLGDEADGVTPPVSGSDQWINQIAIEYEIAHRV